MYMYCDQCWADDGLTWWVQMWGLMPSELSGSCSELFARTPSERQWKKEEGGRAEWGMAQLHEEL